MDDTIAQKISKLLGMPVTEFTKALLKPKIKTGREFTVRSQNMAQVKEVWEKGGGSGGREEGLMQFMLLQGHNVWVWPPWV